MYVSKYTYKLILIFCNENMYCVIDCIALYGFCERNETERMNWLDSTVKDTVFNYNK